ncbi:hypothetical protein [Flavobacterium sp.]|uniref:hypothetical protein n=1 Tax=Flavobacterium sp. TaxID=239 RepID=UPI0031D79A61
MKGIIVNQIDPKDSGKAFLTAVKKANPNYTVKIINTYMVLIPHITCLKELDNGTYLRLACGLELYVIDKYIDIIEKISLLDR